MGLEWERAQREKLVLEAETKNYRIAEGDRNGISIIQHQ